MPYNPSCGGQNAVRCKEWEDATRLCILYYATFRVHEFPLKHESPPPRFSFVEFSTFFGLFFKFSMIQHQHRRALHRTCFPY